MPETAENADNISAFDAANYAFQMTAELSRMARDGGLEPLAKALEQAHALAAQSMLALRQPQGQSS
ncbi:MAG TPA: hypothetical protein VG943_03720 [Caulobacterales bacterium]|nr:hypothetical protein [Caulobacterales bacterium]